MGVSSLWTVGITLYNLLILLSTYLLAYLEDTAEVVLRGSLLNSYYGSFTALWSPICTFPFQNLKPLCLWLGPDDLQQYLPARILLGFFFLVALSLLHWGIKKVLVKKSTNTSLAWKTGHPKNYSLNNTFSWLLLSNLGRLWE